MAPNDEYGGDSDEDDGFDDDVPGGGGSGSNNDQPEENPFTAFAEAHAKAARRRARTPDMDGNHDAAMQDVDLGGDGDGDTDGNDDDLEGTEHGNPFAAYAQQHRNGSGGGKGGHSNTTHAGQGGADDDDDDDSTDDDIEDVTPVRSAVSKPAPPKYGGSARKKAAGWGGGGASSDDETAVTAITANTTNTKKTKKFAGISNNRSDVEEDYGTGLFTISDDKEDDENGESDTDEDEPFGNSLVKGMPKRRKMSRMDSKDSAYEDASDDDDGSEGSSASEDPTPFAKYTGEAEEDEENPFGKYVSSATRRAARQREDEELMDDLFPEDTAGGRQDGGHSHGGGGGFGEDGDHDDYDGLDDDDDESPRNAKSKDSGAGTTPTGMISYDRDFEDADYDLDELDENYDTIKAYEKRRGMLTKRQWAVVLAIVTCISVLLAIIVGLSVALASSNKKNADSIKNGGNGKNTLGGSIDDEKILPARPHVVSQSYLQTYSGQDIETIESTMTIEQYEELMASYLTYYIGGVGEDDTAKLTSIKDEDEAGDGDASATLTFIDQDGNIANLPYTEGADGNKKIEVGEGQTLVFGGNVGGGTRHQRSLVLQMGSVTARCTFNFQRLSSTATRNRRHNSGGGGRRENRQRYRGLRRRRAQALPPPQEVLDAANEIGDGTLSITGAAPTFYDGSDGAEGGGEQPLTPNTSSKPTCPPGMEAVRGSNGQVIGCSPSKIPATGENMPTSAVGAIPERPADSESTLPVLTNEMVFLDEENPPDELDGEAAIATATVLDMMTTEEDDSMHLEIDFTMTWSASSHRSSQGDNDGNTKSESETNDTLNGDEDKVLRDLEHFPKHFELFMNSQRGKRQQLHDLTKVLELDVEAISDVVEREPLKHKFTDVPTVAPTPAPFAATSLQPTPEDGCCFFGVCLFSC